MSLFCYAFAWLCLGMSLLCYVLVWLCRCFAMSLLGCVIALLCLCLAMRLLCYASALSCLCFDASSLCYFSTLLCPCLAISFVGNVFAGLSLYFVTSWLVWFESCVPRNFSEASLKIMFLHWKSSLGNSPSWTISKKAAGDH